MRNKLIILAACVFILITAAVISTILGNFQQFILLNNDADTPTPTISPIDDPAAVPTATQYIMPTIAPTELPTAVPTATPEPMPQYTNIVVGFTGDIIGHERLIENGIIWDNGTKSYSYDHILQYIRPALEYPDLMIANLESPVAGEAAGYSVTNSLTFNFPDEIVNAIKASGIDMVLNANNHASDKNPEGLYRTLDMLDSVGLMHTGGWRSPEERAIPTVIDLQGIKVGIVSATFSLNGRESHVSDEVLKYMTCFIDKEQVREQIDLCREHGAEIVIVSPHMGDEYQQYTRAGIRSYAKAYIKLGADLVVAHHPHVLQPSELLQVTLDDGTVKEGIVFYSIGNFMHNQVTLDSDFAREVRETGIVLYVNIQKDNYTGEVKIKSLEYLPIWMLRRSDLSPRIYAVLPAGNQIDFESSPYDQLPLSTSNFKSLQRAWNLALSQIGTNYATPLSEVPVREIDVNKLSQEN